MEKPSVTFLWRESAPYVVSIYHGTENNKRQNLSIHTKYFKVSCWYRAGSQNLTYPSQKATMSVLLLQPVHSLNVASAANACQGCRSFHSSGRPAVWFTEHLISYKRTATISMLKLLPLWLERKDLNYTSLVFCSLSKKRNLNCRLLLALIQSMPGVSNSRPRGLVLCRF